jgi:hypothetical protein
MAFLKAEYTRDGITGNQCILPPSLQTMDRKYSTSLTDAFGSTLNLESVSRVWRPNSPPEVLFSCPLGVPELASPPTPEEFQKYYVNNGCPFVIRNFTGLHSNISAAHLWKNDTYLASQVGDLNVHVRRSGVKDNFFHYAFKLSEPRQMTFKAFLDTLGDGNSSHQGERFYAGGIPLLYGRENSVFHALLPDVQPAPAFASSVLDLKHINLWMGSGEVLNPLHYDPNENLLVMLSGKKTLTLLPPGARNLLLPHMQREGSAPFSRMYLLETASEAEYPCLNHAKAMASTVTLLEGDLLYIPPYYWHSVVSNGRSLAINYWYTVSSALLQQIMKSLDHSMLLHNEDLDEYRPLFSRQPVW